MKNLKLIQMGFYNRVLCGGHFHWNDNVQIFPRLTMKFLVVLNGLIYYQIKGKKVNVNFRKNKLSIMEITYTMNFITLVYFFLQKNTFIYMEIG